MLDTKTTKEQLLSSCFKCGQIRRHIDFGTAAECYSQFIGVGTMMSPAVFARRSLSYLMTDMPQEALNDAVQAQVISPVWHIASYLQAASLFAMGKENEAQFALKKGSVLEEPEESILALDLIRDRNIQMLTDSCLEGRFSSDEGTLSWYVWLRDAYSMSQENGQTQSLVTALVPLQKEPAVS